MTRKNTKSPNIDGWPPILCLSVKVKGRLPVTGTPVGSSTDEWLIDFAVWLKM